MTTASMTGLLRYLRKIADLSSDAGVGDAELLERFVQRRDEVAFELLIWRHQRMVLGVCRRILGNAHDAEDAFQATFFALARKADAIGRRQAVAAWLHTVASRIALRIRAARRKQTDIDLAILAAPGDGGEDVVRRELASVVDEEVGRLPKKYRLAVVLCYLQGKSYAEASRQLDLAVGTLAGHLARARTLLRKRLTRRGIDVSTTVLAVLLSEQASSGSASAALVKAATTLAASSSPSAASATVAALAEGALRSIFLFKVKFMMAAVLAGALVAGMGVLIPAVALAPPSGSSESPPSPAASAKNTAKTTRLDRYGDALPAGALFRFGSVHMRHTPAITASALSPNGKFLATSSGRSVILWDLTTEKSIRRFRTDPHWCFSNPGIAFSPDGRHLGYVQSSDFACVWDVNNGRQIAEFVGGKRHNTICQFTSDGKNFILGDDKRIIFWDLQANKEARSIPMPDVFLLSPDAHFGVQFDTMWALLFHDVRTGERTIRLKVEAKYNGIENGVAFAPDGKTLAVVHRNKEIRIHAFPDGKLRFSIPLPGSARQPSPNEEYCEYKLFFVDNKTLSLGTSRGLIHRWNLANGKELPSLKRHFGAVSGVHVTPDAETLVSTGMDGVIRRWDRRTGGELSQPPGNMGRTHAVYSPDGCRVVVGDARGRLEVWDSRNGRSLRVLLREGPAITKLAIAAKNQLLAAARADNTVYLCKLAEDGEPRILHCEKIHNLAFVRTMRFSPDGRHLLIADGDCRARLWELASGKVRWRARFPSAVFAPDGKTLATVWAGPCLNWLDASSGKPHAELRPNIGISRSENGVSAIAVSPDGRRLALAVHGVFLCEARTGAMIHHFQAVDWPKESPPEDRRRAHMRGDGGVHGLAFSSDGRWLGTSGIDGSVRLWEVATGKQVLRLNGHAGDVKQIAFGADNQTILSCGEDAQVYLWSLRPQMKKIGNPPFDSLWAALVGDPAKAYRAIWTLSEAKDAVAFLGGKIASVKPVTEKRLKQLIADLDSESFAVRDSATKTLAKLGETAVPAMRQALANKPSLEMRKRMENLIQRSQSMTRTKEGLRMERALDALERMGTPEARRVLKTLADGAAGAWLTRTAKAALKRGRVPK